MAFVGSIRIYVILVHYEVIFIVYIPFLIDFLCLTCMVGNFYVHNDENIFSQAYAK